MDMSNRRINLEALISEREGMIAENEQRMIEGRSMAYVAAAFFDNARQIRELLTP